MWMLSPNRLEKFTKNDSTIRPRFAAKDHATPSPAAINHPPSDSLAYHP